MYSLILSINATHGHVTCSDILTIQRFRMFVFAIYWKNQHHLKFFLIGSINDIYEPAIVIIIDSVLPLHIHHLALKAENVAYPLKSLNIFKEIWSCTEN